MRGGTYENQEKSKSGSLVYRPGYEPGSCPTMSVPIRLLRCHIWLFPLFLMRRNEFLLRIQKSVMSIVSLYDCCCCCCCCGTRGSAEYCLVDALWLLPIFLDFSGGTTHIQANFAESIRVLKHTVCCRSHRVPYAAFQMLRFAVFDLVDEEAMNRLRHMMPGGWIGTEAPVSWPPRSTHSPHWIFKA